uniref:Uncharacterized protein n=1 Tax=Oryza meridionalis TaxID=40149 RepID=A0A0E0D7S9_9ORYZ
MDFGELCNDFDSYVEATARQLAGDILVLDLRDDNRVFTCYAVSVKYKDPARTFVGQEKYKRPSWITKALENPTVGELCKPMVSFGLHEVRGCRSERSPPHPSGAAACMQGCRRR